MLVDGDNNFIDGPDAGTAIGPDADPEFGIYPLPNVSTDPTVAPFGNVTQCGLEMGVSRFVTEFNSPVPGGVDGVATPLAGEFFAASGRLDEVTVLDTRDIDTGWKLKADIEDRFTSIANGDSFSGNYLGMLPVVTDDSDVVGGEAPSTNPYNPVSGSPSDVRPGTLYDQLVSTGFQATAPETGFHAGGVVLPGDGFPVGGGQDSAPSTNGMTDNPILASAPAGSGLGIATLDARMLLLIPASVDAADYSATLTLTVAP